LLAFEKLRKIRTDELMLIVAIGLERRREFDINRYLFARRFL
jgi:hypothetical protein